MKASDYAILILTIAKCNYTYIQQQRKTDGADLKCGAALQTAAALKPSDVKNAQLWLDVVWSLAILNEMKPVHVGSVLNQEFLDRLLKGG